jgi:Domain of unknown function (DUF6259)
MRGRSAMSFDKSMKYLKFINFAALIAIVFASGISARADEGRLDKIFTGLSGDANEVTLKDKYWTVGFDKNSGALVRLESHSTRWNMESRPKLGVSFRLNAPTDHHDNFMYGRDQKSVEVTKLSDHQVRLQWKDLVSQDAGVLPITFTAVVSLKGDALTFESTIQNDSSTMVSTLDYPYFGNFNPPTEGAPMKTEHMWYANLADGDIPGKPVESKQTLFCLVQSTNVGLYVEMHDPTEPYLLDWTFEKRGFAKSKENPSRLEFYTTHWAYVHPNTTAVMAPIVLRAYIGDWHAGVDFYKQWRVTWFKEPHLAPWIKDVNSWQQIQIDSPEQDFRVAYTNLIQYGQECADNGVSAIQLVGWNHWGQDGGDPAEDTEPGLGTWQQFHDAIAQIQAKGVNMVLFGGKPNWADLTQPWYTNELYKYECKDENGNRYEQGGYSYYTPTQLAGLNNHRRAIMDFNDPDYRAIAVKEFDKVLALGANGWLWDELCHHASVLYNWAPDHGYTPPGYIYHGDIPLCHEMREDADKMHPDFTLAGEGPEDWLMQDFECSYFRIGNDSKPVCRYIDSNIRLMCAVTGSDDREMLNLILMDGYIISYEPFQFKGYLEDFPLTLAYGKKIDALRRRYKQYLWDADFRDTLGANVTADGAVRHTVFVTSSGKRAVVVVNQELEKSIRAVVSMPDPGQLTVATPEQPDPMPTDGTLEIPARSAAVVMEQ